MTVNIEQEGHGMGSCLCLPEISARNTSITKSATK